jgi:hypothetical protein
MAITGHAIQAMNRRDDPSDERDMLEALAKLDAYRQTSASINQKVDWNAFQTKRGWQ